MDMVNLIKILVVLLVILKGIAVTLALEGKTGDLLYLFSPSYIRRRICFLEFYWWENFGKDKFNGFNIFGLHIIPQNNVKCEYILNQYYNTREIWKVQTFFVLIAHKEE